GKGGQLLPHRDQAYAFYRRGMAYFMAIHPSSWNIASARMLATRIGRQDEEQESIKGKILELMELFPKAYYYFGIVVHEYPESQWAADARDKMDTIEERIGRYRRIIESFGAWDSGEKKASEHRERYDETRRNQEAVRKDEPKEW
ncbi:MAG TPA: outer membrane protein assembly factor BamD, partial [Rectinemataceae bacterium]|nr:outer membrane protein assembly factor BamD [Rectinemataceae bacterium]